METFVVQTAVIQNAKRHARDAESGQMWWRMGGRWCSRISFQLDTDDDDASKTNSHLLLDRIKDILWLTVYMDSSVFARVCSTTL